MKLRLQEVSIIFCICAHGCLLHALCFSPKSITVKYIYRNHVSLLRSLPSDLLAADSNLKRISSTEAALKELGVSTMIEVLSTNPLVYIIPNFLSSHECDMYRQYVQDQCNTNNGRNLTRSNPPDVSLDTKKLWPLPLLSLLAGIPPYFDLLETTATDADIDFFDIAGSVVPTVMETLFSMGLLGFVVILPLIRKISNASSRTSDALALNLKEDLHLIRPLVDRATASVWTEHLNGPFSSSNWEAPVVTKYKRGAVFARHGDASPTRGSEWKDIGGQRLVTCTCYLNTLNKGQGGETYFDKLNLRVQPQKGSALFFYPANATSMEADERMTHESLPPSEEKWIVQLFGRVELVPPPLGLPY